MIISVIIIGKLLFIFVSIICLNRLCVFDWVKLFVVVMLFYIIKVLMEGVIICFLVKLFFFLIFNFFEIKYELNSNMYMVILLIYLINNERRIFFIVYVIVKLIVILFICFRYGYRVFC